MPLILVSLFATLIAGLLFFSQWISGHVARAHPPSGLFMPFGKQRLHLVDKPAGEQEQGAVLLLHGASSQHADLLSALGPQLSDRYRIIAPDRPGLGWSDRIGGADAALPSTQADVMLELIERLETGPVVIVAHSLAGAMAMDMALKRPDRVKGLVLLGAVTHPWPGGIAWHYNFAAAPWIAPVFNRLVAIPFGWMMLEQAMRGVFAPSPEPEGYLERAGIGLLFRPHSFRANAEDVQALHGAVSELSPRYGELTRPIVAFHGLGDTVTWASIHSQPLPEVAERARFVPLPGVGHMPHHAVPARIAAAVDEIAGGISRIAASE
jgi:pimeloyl-ACP methyl ester carboxylesterase